MTLESTQPLTYCFSYNNSCKNVSQCYVVRTLPVLFYDISISIQLWTYSYILRQPVFDWALCDSDIPCVVMRFQDQCSKLYSPSMRNRLRQKMFTTGQVTGHGKLRSYLHRFGLTDNPMCPCEEEEEEEEEEEAETTDHLIFQSKKLRDQKNEMIKQTKKHWWKLA